MVAQLGAKAHEVTTTAGDFARAAVGKIDSVTLGTGDALRTVASRVRNTGRQSAKTIDRFTAGAADKLDAAGCSVKKYRLKNLPAGLRRAVKDHPTSSLIVATAFGFWAASKLHRTYSR